MPNDQIIMFDGVCKLCNRWSRFIIRFDVHKRFKLCAVQTDEGQAILQHFGYPIDYFETMLLVQGDHVLEKSDSFLAVINQLPVPWRFIGVAKIFPKFFRDWLYDRIALNRYWIFGKYNVCLLATPDHEGRFL
jgi:predicted DCC family thiol-disulfide oxidoreductase YuxK